MDKLIRKIEGEVKHGKKKMAEKGLKHLERADKKRDKMCKIGEKMIQSS